METCVVALDIFKAFDRVWHSALIAKLPSFGFTPSLCSFIHSYLSGRSISAVVEGKRSENFLLIVVFPRVLFYLLPFFYFSLMIYLPPPTILFMHMLTIPPFTLLNRLNPPPQRLTVPNPDFEYPTQSPKICWVSHSGEPTIWLNLTHLKLNCFLFLVPAPHPIFMLFSEMILLLPPTMLTF